MAVFPSCQGLVQFSMKRIVAGVKPIRNFSEIFNKNLTPSKTIGVDTVKVLYWRWSETEVAPMLIERKEYLNFLIEWKEQQIIKVVTGI